MCLDTMSPESEPKSFENRLKSVRSAKGLSQGALAAKTGITRQAVSAIGADAYLPSTVVALRLRHRRFLSASKSPRLEPERLFVQSSALAMSCPMRFRLTAI
jgi:DNA-binding XRE family transcriptional regulator